MCAKKDKWVVYASLALVILPFYGGQSIQNDTFCWFVECGSETIDMCSYSAWPVKLQLFALTTIVNRLLVSGICWAPFVSLSLMKSLVPHSQAEGLSM